MGTTREQPLSCKNALQSLKLDVLLGQKTNSLDPEFGSLLQQLVASSEQVDISPAQFLSAFYGSLTRESGLVLVTLPVILLLAALMASLLALPTLALMSRYSVIQPFIVILL